jgi:hypothetical protein
MDIRICECMYTYICMYVCRYVCRYVCMYVCVCVCVCVCRQRLLLAVEGACHAGAVDYYVEFATRRHVLVFEHA